MTFDSETRSWASQRIRLAGLRSTPARIATLCSLREAPRPLTHAEVYSCLLGQGFDKATIFRNLKDLTRAKLLQRTELGDRVWRFEVLNQNDELSQDQPNFFCTDCGSISPAKTVSLTKTSESLVNALGSIKQILLRGRCTECMS